MGEQKPEAEDRLSKDVENGVGDDLSIDTGNAATIGDTPDTSEVRELSYIRNELTWDRWSRESR